MPNNYPTVYKKLVINKYLSRDTPIDKFIDRYYSKIFKIRNKSQPELDSDEYLKGRCELLISKNFKKIYECYSSGGEFGGAGHGKANEGRPLGRR